MSEILRHANENTVDSRAQVNGVRFFREGADGRPRILFLGNSITIHGPKPWIGWNHDYWGMAASARENDYVHLLMRRLREINPEASFGIVQCADWERNFWEREKQLDLASEARSWEADIIVVRLSENTPAAALEGRDYAEEVAWLIDYFNPTGKANVVVTDGFWPNPPKDLCMYRASQLRNARFVSLTDLGQRDDMKALGLFEHTGVANHPGDAGMAAIADRLFTAMKDMV